MRSRFTLAHTGPNGKFPRPTSRLPRGQAESIIARFSRASLPLLIDCLAIADDETVSGRSVWPIFVGYIVSGRILDAWFELNEAFRYFRMDRMNAAELLEELKPDRQPLLRLRWEAAMSAERGEYPEAERRPTMLLSLQLGRQQTVGFAAVDAFR